MRLLPSPLPLSRMASNHVARNTLKAAIDGSIPAPFCAVVHVYDAFVSKHGRNLFRFALTDGDYVAAGVATRELAEPLVSSGAIAAGAAIRITRYTIKATASGSVIIISAMEPVGASPEQESAAAPSATPPSQIVAISSSSSAASDPDDEEPATPSPGAAQTSPPLQFTPISDLFVGIGGFTLWVRVIAKAPPRSYSNTRGRGTLVTLTLMDESGQLDAIMFNEYVDRFNPLLRVGATYIIRGGVIQLTERQRCRSANQLVFNNSTSVEMSARAGPPIPRMQYKFVDLSALADAPDKAFVDVLAAVVAIGPVIESAKGGRSVTRRVITLADRDLHPIELTLWDACAREYAGAVGTIVAIKDAQISHYGGVLRLTALGTTAFAHHPSFPRAAELKCWYEEQPKPLALAAVARGSAGAVGTAPRCTLADVRGLGLGDKADFRVVRATVTRFTMPDRDPWYYAHRVAAPGGGGDRWEKCDPGLSDAEPRFLVSCVITDGLGELHVSAFDAAAQALLGVRSMGEAQHLARDELYAQACFQRHVLTLRLKVEERDGERRLRTTVTAVEPVNYVKESGIVLEQLQRIMPRLFVNAGPATAAAI